MLQGISNMEWIPHDLKIDFLGKAWIAFFISAASIVWAFYLWFHLGDTKYGVDFRGGYELVVKVGGESNSEKIRAALETKGIGGAIVQAFQGTDQGEYVIRIGAEEHLGENTPVATDSAAVPRKVQEVLKADFGEVVMLKTDFVGPAVGAELRQNGLIALVLSLLVMLVYVSFRFEFAFGLGAVATLFHDAITTMGFYLFAGYTVNMITLAAALIVIGYSMHDNIIIFDRIREDASKKKSYNLVELINAAVNVTLSRTLITSSLTLLSCLALLIWGGGAISDLAYFLVVGVIVGTYSSIYVACPIAILWHRYRGGSLEIKE